jgi:hypothetical protein
MFHRDGSEPEGLALRPGDGQTWLLVVDDAAGLRPEATWGRRRKMGQRRQDPSRKSAA